MNNTKASLEAIVPVSIFDEVKLSPNEKVQINLKFELTLEDWELFKASREFMNSKTGQGDDYGDHMLALITWAIHQATEMRTGKPFTLRMDRPKN